MLKKISGILALFVLLIACDNKPRMVLYTWSDMFPPEILTGFESETGIRVQYVNFEYNETMLARLQADRRGSYDLIIADDYMVETVIQEGLAARLDRSLLTNFRNIDPFFQGHFYDPTDGFTVPYGAGVVTIVYDPRLVDTPINSYADLWNTALEQKLGILGNFRVINGMALKVMGESYNTNNLGTIQAAGNLLLQLAPNIRLIRDYSLDDELLSGEISAAVMYTEMVTEAIRARRDLRMIFPTEGIGFGIMPAFIPHNAPNPGAAHAFLNYILDPRRGAECFEYLGYYSTFSASNPYIDPGQREFLILPEEFLNLDIMEMIGNVSDEARELHNEIWTAFRRAAGQE